MAVRGSKENPRSTGRAAATGVAFGAVLLGACGNQAPEARPTTPAVSTPATPSGPEITDPLHAELITRSYAVETTTPAPTLDRIAGYVACMDKSGHRLLSVSVRGLSSKERDGKTREHAAAQRAL